MNDAVDGLAISAARADRVSFAQRKRVRALWDKVAAIAMWIGQATVLANEFPHLEVCPGGRRRNIRDSEGRQALGAGRAKRDLKRKTPPLELPPAGCADGLQSAAVVGPDDVQVRHVRRRLGSMGRVTPSAAASSRRRAGAAAREAVRAGLEAEARVARWLATITLAPSQQLPAADRFAALRARVRAKEASQAARATSCQSPSTVDGAADGAQLCAVDPAPNSMHRVGPGP